MLTCLNYTPYEMLADFYDLQVCELRTEKENRKQAFLAKVESLNC